MKLAKKIYYKFSQYTGPNERRIANYFRSITEKSNGGKVRKNLIYLLQTDAVAVNLWSEYKYRQYRYLNKTKRAVLYKNALEIANNVLDDYENNRPSMRDITSELENIGIDFKSINADLDKLVFLKTIMNYLSPKNDIYVYRDSSTFGALLANPNNEKLIGDCNQIVTLYIYLYSLKYNIEDLKLSLLPGHVAIHYQGIDIEATSGNFNDYSNKDRVISPIEEIVSINLLDTNDSYFKTHKVDATAILESARIAYLISNNHELVDNNLKAAYSNLINEKIKSNNFASALELAKHSKQKNLINLVGHNGAIYYMGINQFKEAHKYAGYADDKSKLIKIIDEHTAHFYYKKENYQLAIKYFEKVGNYDAVKSCYHNLFVKEQKNLGNIKTIEDIKNNKNRIRDMANYAKKSGNKELIKYTEGLIKYL